MNCCLVGNVAWQGVRDATRRVNPGGDLLELGTPARYEHDFASALRELFGERATEPATRPRHESGFSLELHDEDLLSKAYVHSENALSRLPILWQDANRWI
jgi:hypothetical protein